MEPILTPTGVEHRCLRDTISYCRNSVLCAVQGNERPPRAFAHCEAAACRAAGVVDFWRPRHPDPPFVLLRHGDAAPQVGNRVLPQAGVARARTALDRLPRQQHLFGALKMTLFMLLQAFAGPAVGADRHSNPYSWGSWGELLQYYTNCPGCLPDTPEGLGHQTSTPRPCTPHSLQPVTVFWFLGRMHGPRSTSARHNAERLTSSQLRVQFQGVRRASRQPHFTRRPLLLGRVAKSVLLSAAVPGTLLPAPSSTTSHFPRRSQATMSAEARGLLPYVGRCCHR